MTDMSMNKAIHGAVRRDLDRFVAALSAFPAGDATRAGQLGKAWANYEDQLTYHHEGEHAIAWPRLQSIGVSPELLATLDSEHERMATAMRETGTTMAALQARPGADEAATALAAFAHLREVTVAHLDHEEAEIEEVYLANRESPQMKAMGCEFGKVSPSRGGRFFAWVLDGATPAEQAAVTGEVPKPVLAVLGGVFGRGYRKDVAPVWRS